MIETVLPSAARVSLLHQREEQRYIAHLLYAAPMKRGRCEVIEDLPELRDVSLTLRLPRQVKRLSIVPGGEELEFSADGHKTTDGEWTFLQTTIPAFTMHCAVVAEYGE